MPTDLEVINGFIERGLIEDNANINGLYTYDCSIACDIYRYPISYDERFKSNIELLLKRIRVIYGSTKQFSKLSEEKQTIIKLIL